ncbi:hypothetical protein FA13DRAFT_1733013 [Coprinellus micaceus]|uniref:G-protein coupled receptors family 3 profile domain-containing protein n=1 Tax=Coprinellus micaceus TaxID=71717 RepID=A0A4Y7TAU2_COPMI|nr:hypothetical protein FA13DRAFT_1733013 [Coprinellus micaceus]
MTSQSQTGTQDKAAVSAFIALQLIGAGGLLIVVFTAAACKNIKRWPTWYSFCGSWIFSSLCYSLLTLAGQQYRQPPNTTICLIQAATVYAAPPLTTCTTLSLIIHILLRLRFAKSDVRPESGRETTLVLLLTPYSVWVVILVGFFLFTSHNMNTLGVSPTGTFCHSSDPIWAGMSFTVVIVAAVFIVAIQAYLGIFIYRNSELRLDNGHLFTTAIRTIAFGCIGLLTLIIAVAYATRPTHDKGFDLVMATFPILALATFGTQSDLVEAYAFWRRRPTYAPLKNVG